MDKDLGQDTNVKKKWDYKNTLVNGFKNGLNTLWVLTKIMVPVYFFVTFLKYTSILGKMSDLCGPLMKLVGLPGEAAITLVLGNFVNLIAAIGAIATLSLNTKQITIIAVMLSFSHSLFLETAVAKKTGMSVMLVVTIRVTLSILSGVILNIVL